MSFGDDVITTGEIKALENEWIISDGRTTSVQLGFAPTDSPPRMLTISVYRSAALEEQVALAAEDLLELARSFKGGKARVPSPNHFDGEINAYITGNRMVRIRLYERDETGELAPEPNQIEITLSEMNFLVTQIKNELQSVYV